MPCRYNGDGVVSARCCACVCNTPSSLRRWHLWLLLLSFEADAACKDLAEPGPRLHTVHSQIIEQGVDDEILEQGASPASPTLSKQAPTGTDCTMHHNVGASACLSASLNLPQSGSIKGQSVQRICNAEGMFISSGGLPRVASSDSLLQNMQAA